MQKTVKTYLNLILHIHSFSKSLPQQKPVIASALLRWAQGWNLVGKKQLKTSEKMDMMWFKRAKSVIQSKSSCISTRHLQHHSGSSLRNGEKNISTYSHIHWKYNHQYNWIKNKIAKLAQNEPLLWCFFSLPWQGLPNPFLLSSSQVFTDPHEARLQIRNPLAFSCFLGSKTVGTLKGENVIKFTTQKKLKDILKYH